MGGLDIGVILVAGLVLGQLGGQIGLGGGLGGGDSLAAIGVHRRPGDGDGHVVEAGGQPQERIGHHLVALGDVASLIHAGIVERGAHLVGVGLQPADADAADGVLLTVDRIGHVAQHAGGIAVVLLRYEHGHALVGDAPAVAGDDAGAAQLARADSRVTAQEIRRVVGVDAGVDILRQGGGLGDLGIGIAVVDILAGAESEQLALHVAADLRRIIIVHAGTVLQIGDHAVQRRLIGSGDAAVKLLLEGQLALDGGGETVGQRLHHGVVLLLLLARQLAQLIARHGLVAGLQVFDLLLRRGVQFGHIVGQGVQQAAELLKIEPVAVVGTVLQLLDVLDGLLLGVTR